MPKKEDKKGQSRSSTVKSQVEQPNTNQQQPAYTRKQPTSS